MKRLLSIAKGPKQQLFLSYLNSELSKLSIRSQAESELTPNGSFNTTLHTVLRVNADELELKWLIETSRTGELISVEASPIGVSLDLPTMNWERIAEDIVNSALLSAFNERRTRIAVRRILYYVGPQLDGEYLFRGLRLAPAIQDDTLPCAFNAERVVTFDFQVDSIDSHDAAYLASQFSRSAAARVSLLLDVDLYEQAGEQVWVQAPNESQSERLNRGVFNIPVPTTMPCRSNVSDRGSWGEPIASFRRTAQTLKMPPETRKILRGIDGLPEPTRNAFDGAARMYQIGLSLTRRFPSAALAYRVAAIDALQQTEPDCNGFSQFMRKYSPEVAAEPRILEYLHGEIRSSHFHAGKFDLGEFSTRRYMDIVQDQDSVHLSLMHHRCFELTRGALVNWMISISATT